ncbi:cytochrome P450 family 4 [Thermoflexales bacterium]|nr:cytochrome P450 family 4 [Thermoflexales bacterium]
MSIQLPPQPSAQAGRLALTALLREKNLLAALEVFRAELGDAFSFNLLGFNPIMLSGPEANRCLLVEQRDRFSWRMPTDPVAKLLHQGLLVTDGAEHDHLRRTMLPALHKKRLSAYAELFRHYTDQVTATWQDGQTRDMLIEMRRVALLILVGTLFRVDFTPDMDNLWPAILKMLKHISPGLWMFWTNAPAGHAAPALHAVDHYLYGIIRDRRNEHAGGADLLGTLIASGMDDGLIRDQLLTMFIAGHDTSTALLAWTLYLLGKHPHVLARVRDEVDANLQGDPPTLENTAQLRYLQCVIDETLRMYPPIHLGTRRIVSDLQFQGYDLPQGRRANYSIYLTQRNPNFWPDPGVFNPDRFLPENERGRQPYTYLPFGGGPRNCIGAAFAQVESKIVIARLIQLFDFTLEPTKVHVYMGATLEPRPGVRMTVKKRQPEVMSPQVTLVSQAEGGLVYESI